MDQKTAKMKSIKQFSQILLVLIVLLALGGLSVNTKILPKFVTYYLSYFMWYPNKVVAKIKHKKRSGYNE